MPSFRTAPGGASARRRAPGGSGAANRGHRDSGWSQPRRSVALRSDVPARGRRPTAVGQRRTRMATKTLKLLIAAVAFLTPAPAQAVALAGVLGATAAVTAAC